MLLELQSKLNCPMAMRFKKLVDEAFTILSLVGVPMLAGVVLYWVLESPSHNTVKSKAKVYLSATKGETKNLNPNIEVLVDTPLVTYRISLKDGLGNIVYQYPAMQVKSVADDDSHSGILLTVPHSIQSGTYEVVADIEYPTNPLKSGKVRVEMAYLTIQ